jgi:hypothetical protein
MMNLCFLAALAVCRFGGDASAIFLGIMFLLGGFVCSVPHSLEKQHAVGVVWSAGTLIGTIALACV